MGWSVNISGGYGNDEGDDENPKNDAACEAKERKLLAVARGMASSNGTSGTFTGDYVGTVNLLDEE